MTDDLEKTLHRSLRPQHPSGDFSARVLARLDATGAPSAAVIPLGSRRRRAFRSPWLPAALAACIVAGIGIVQMRQHAIDAARANQARAQLLEALRIASANVNVVRAAVAREENPDS
jgi:hypothetical protein